MGGAPIYSPSHPSGADDPVGAEVRQIGGTVGRGGEPLVAIDHVVAAGRDAHVVFHHHDRVVRVHEPMQLLEEPIALRVDLESLGDELLQRGHGPERLPGPGKLPVLHQFLTVEVQPLKDVAPVPAAGIDPSRRRPGCPP